jgi:hypothetical protein
LFGFPLRPRLFSRLWSGARRPPPQEIHRPPQPLALKNQNQQPTTTAPHNANIAHQPNNQKQNTPNNSTVADGTCAFPQNMFGCESAAGGLTKGVKFIADDRALECEGKEAGKCASRAIFSK